MSHAGFTFLYSGTYLSILMHLDLNLLAIDYWTVWASHVSLKHLPFSVLKKIRWF